MSNSSSKGFTPGPWHQLKSNNLCIESASGNVALCNLARESDADARLIAAAPELLEALRDCTQWLESYDSRGMAGSAVLKSIMDANAAIRKASTP
jgi:hypothetical protein